MRAAAQGTGPVALRLIRARARRAGEAADHGYAGSEAASERNGRSNRTWIMLVLVLGVAGVALLVMERSAGPPVSVLPTPALQGEPDIYMEAPVVSQYRPDGTLEYRLVAARASHYQRDAVTRLREPHFTLLRPGTAPWTVSARTGSLQRVSATEEIVSLDENVTLEQSRADGRQIRLTTPYLRLYPRRQYAETDRDVMIQGLFGQTTATGLEGDLQSGTLELYSTADSPVRTVLQPEQFK